MRFTQPVMVQSFKDKFEIAEDAMRRPPTTSPPGEPNTVLPVPKPDESPAYDSVE